MSRIRRYPQLAHWGAFTAVVEDGVLTRCEPFAHDPAPSPMLASIPEAVYSDQRIRQPMVRRSWLERRERSDQPARAGGLSRIRTSAVQRRDHPAVFGSARR